MDGVLATNYQVNQNCIGHTLPDLLQFTLCHVLKGNKPDFRNALTSEQSGPIYQDFLKTLGSMYKSEAIKGGCDP